MIRVILTDIEGTTSSISFVRDVLFPYAAQHLAMFVRANAQRADVQEQLLAVAREVGVPESDYAAIIDVLLKWIAEDRKATPLKALQGMLWEHGYRNGDYRAHVYADAYEYLQKWQREGLKIFVYSSGSVQAQKLFFGYSEFGDMLPIFTGYFDTTIGAKQDATSYSSIVAEIGVPAHSILFLSDIAAELDAAKAAGLQTCWLVRPADTVADEAGIEKSVHSIARNFSQVVWG